MTEGTDPRDDGLRATVLDWYAGHARDLPWRRPDASPWGVLVSEVMLQQTPVVRVLPVWQEWLARWPEPADLAAAGRGEAVRAWGRLGYPRRAARLHECAVLIGAEHGGRVPDDPVVLRTLPGIGEYTANAVAAFAFGRSVPVVDTNVARVLGRVVAGEALPPPSGGPGRRIAAELLPPGDADPGLAPRWSVAVMELGALVCTARAPDCPSCPLQTRCRWRLAGRPDYAGPPRRGQAWHGTDRQCRGVVLQLLRTATSPVARDDLDGAWPDAGQLDRALAGLLADGLAQVCPAGWTLPA